MNRHSKRIGINLNFHLYNSIKSINKYGRTKRKYNTDSRDKTLKNNFYKTMIDYSENPVIAK